MLDALNSVLQERHRERLGMRMNIFELRIQISVNLLFSHTNFHLLLLGSLKRRADYRIHRLTLVGVH